MWHSNHMAYLVRIVEWKTGGREFLVFCRELPPTLLESISQAKPISLHELSNGFGNSVGTELRPLVDDVDSRPDRPS